MKINRAKKLLTLWTLLAFSFLVMFSDYGLAQGETPLARAQGLFSQGQYDEAVQVLDGYIAAIQANPEQKPNLAAANYLLAKVYFEVGDDGKCDEALLKVFSALPGFDRDEPNFGFRERVLKAKARLAGNLPVAAETTAQPIIQQAKVEPTMANTEPLPTKSDTKTVEQPLKTEPKTIEIPKQGSGKGMKKKKKFPILLILLGVTVIGVVLAIIIFMKSYDIRGSWNFDYMDGNDPNTLTCSGSRSSGEIKFDNPFDGVETYGTYNVDGKQLSMHEDVSSSRYYEYSGQFENKDFFKGTWKYYRDGALYRSGTFEARRK